MAELLSTLTRMWALLGSNPKQIFCLALIASLLATLWLVPGFWKSTDFLFSHEIPHQINKMARNEEKHFGLLNRLVLQKEKEEYEKKTPKRPRLDCLDTVEEIQKWLPSIKQELEFYLKKSEVICYSDDHIEECKKKVVHLEKEYKAFVRKIVQLTPGKLEAVPWTNRAYKRKNLEDPLVTLPTKGPFRPIEAPILKKEKTEEPSTEKHNSVVILPYMDEPLSFKSSSENSVNSTGSLKTVNETPLSSPSSGTKKLTTDDPINNNVDVSDKHLSTLVDYLDSDSDS